MPNRCRRITSEAASRFWIPTFSSTTMAESLAPQCTPLKTAYDTCFNSWFEGYLEPAVAASQTADREAYSKTKAEEYQQKCGKVWEEYKTCLQVRLSLYT